MKIAVYTIALNEEKFVERWYNSAKEADYLLIADTGSSDKTVKKAKSLGINVVTVNVSPWRFDDARNASLAALPKDIDFCVALDMDEILLPGWREELEISYYATGANRIRYNYVWNWVDADQTIPSTQFYADKIHARHGFRWVHPIHECLNAYGSTVETQAYTKLEIHHHPDHTKSRSQYLPLLEMSVREAPQDDRNCFYYARELYFYGKYKEAAAEFRRHLSLPSSVWPPERAASMRYLARLEPEDREGWLQLAIEEAPGRREALVEMAQHWYMEQDWEQCYKAAKAALSIEEKPLEYLCEEFAWGWLPYDLAAIASYRLENYEEALELGKKALELNPEDARLADNLKYYTDAVT